MSEQSSPNIKPYTWVSRMEGANTKVKRGFTLIEVLVSLGIVATIVGLLIPALLAARANANRKPENEILLDYCVKNDKIIVIIRNGMVG